MHFHVFSKLFQCIFNAFSFDFSMHFHGFSKLFQRIFNAFPPLVAMAATCCQPGPDPPTRADWIHPRGWIGRSQCPAVAGHWGSGTDRPISVPSCGWALRSGIPARCSSARAPREHWDRPVTPQLAGSAWPRPGTPGRRSRVGAAFLAYMKIEFGLLDLLLDAMVTVNTFKCSKSPTQTLKCCLAYSGGQGTLF